MLAILTPGHARFEFEVFLVQMCGLLHTSLFVNKLIIVSLQFSRARCEKKSFKRSTFSGRTLTKVVKKEQVNLIDSFSH